MSIDNLVNISQKINNDKLEIFRKNNQKIKIGIMGCTFDPIH